MADVVQAGTFDEMPPETRTGAYVVTDPPEKRGVYIAELSEPWTASRAAAGFAKVKAGALSDADFVNPTDGLAGVDTTSPGQVQVRIGGRWWRIRRDYIDARDYGFGDGVTGDGVAMQAAYLASQGRVIYLARGTYELGTTPIFGTQWTPRFVGDGMDATILHYTSNRVTSLFSFSGAIAAPISLGADAVIGDTQLTLASTAGLAVGDYLLMISNAIWTPGEPTGKQGEYVRIYSVDDATHVTLYGHIVDTYTLANSAVARKVTFLDGPRFEGFSIVNTTPASNNAGAAIVDLGYTRRAHVDTIHLDATVGAGFLMRQSIDWDVSDCAFKDVSSQEQYAPNALGYGVMAYGASSNGVVKGCRSTAGHHLFTTNGDPTIGGVPRGIVVSACTAREGVEAPFHTHPSGEFITFDGCSVFGGGKKDVLTTYPHGFSVNCRRSAINNPVVRDIYGIGITLGVDAVEITVNDPDVANCRTSSGAGSPANQNSGTGIYCGVGGGHKINGGSVRDCDIAGIYVDGPASVGTRVKDTYVRAGGTPGAKYGLWVNDANDLCVSDGLIVENADEAIHIQNPVTPTPQHTRVRLINTTKKSNKPAAIADGGYLALVYSAAITPDLTSGRRFSVIVTNGSAFTINAPLNPENGVEITFDIKNSSGGAMGAVTWNAVFLLAGAFTNPANTKRRTITFYFDGTNWVEKDRAQADI